MARRYFNWKLAVVLLVSFSVLVVTAYGLRKWQKSQRADLAIEEGINAYQQCKWDEAASKFGRYISSNPEDIEILKKYADAQLKRRPRKATSTQQAVAAYRNILRTDKEDFEVARDLAGLYIQMGMPGEAELIISRFPDLDSNAELSTLLARAMVYQREFDKAAKQLNKVISNHPEHIAAYSALSILASQRPESVSHPVEYWVNKAVENNPSSALAYIARSSYYLGKNDIEAAKNDIEAAKKLDLINNHEKMLMAKTLIVSGDLDAAEKYLVDVRSQEPENQSLWKLLLQHAMALRSNDKVLEVVEEGLKTLEKDPWDFMLLATEIYIRCDQIESANECIARLNEKEINPKTVVCLEAMVIDRQGDAYQAVKAWKKVIESGNSNPSFRLSLANAYLRARDSISATRVLKELVSDIPGYLPAHLILANQAVKTANWDQAEKHVGNAVRIAPDNPEAKMLYIQTKIQKVSIKKESKEKEQAVKAIEKEIEGIEETSATIMQKGLMRFKIAAIKHDYETAEKIVDQLKSDFPSQVKPAMAKAELYYYQHSTSETKDSLQKTIDSLQNTMNSFPAAIEPVQFLASILALQDERDKCEELITDSIKRIDDSGKKLTLAFRLADLYRQWDRQDDMNLLLTGFAEDYQNSIPLKMKLLSCRKVMEDSQRAQEIVDDIKVKVGDNSWQWRHPQVLVWLASENFQAHYPEILSLLKKNIAENPDDRQSRLLLAHSYEMADEAEMALSTLRQALDRSPDDEKIMLLMASALNRAGEFDQVDEILGKISEERLKSPQLLEMQMQRYLRQGDYSKATEVISDSLIPGLDDSDKRLTLELLQIRIEMQQEHFDKAALLLDELIKQKPDKMQVINAQVRLQLAQNKYEDAIAICNELVKKRNDVESYIFRARTYATANQPDKALEDLDHVVEKEPGNKDVWVARCDFYASNGQIGKAAEDIRQGLSLDKTDLQVQKKAITVFLSSGADQDTILEGNDLLETVLKANPDDFDLRILKARLLFASGTKPGMDESIVILKDLADQRPEQSDVWLLLGQISMNRQEYSKAIDYAFKGLMLNANERDLLLLKAQSEYMRSPILAVPTLKMLCDLDPTDVNNAISLAEVYLKIGQPQKAVVLLSNQLDRIETELDHLKCEVALAEAKFKNGQKNEAIDKFKYLIESNPNNSRAILVYAKILLKDNRCEEFRSTMISWMGNNPDNLITPISILENVTAGDLGNSKKNKAIEEVLQVIIKKYPDRVEGQQVLAILYQRTGKSIEAAELYQKVLKVKPNDVITINNLAWAFYENQNRYQEALVLANRGLAIAPEYIDLIDTRGSVYLALKKYDKAIVDFNKCIELYPERNPALISTHLHLANALVGCGQIQEAVKHLNIVLNRGPQVKGVLPEVVSEAKILLQTLSGGK